MLYRNYQTKPIVDTSTINNNEIMIEDIFNTPSSDVTEDDHKHLHYNYDHLGHEVPSYINHDHIYHHKNNYDHSHNDHTHSDYSQNDYRYLDHESYEQPNNDHYHEVHSFDDDQELANEHAQWNAYKTGTRTYFRPTPPTSFQQRAPESEASGKKTKI